ncbi:glycan-binding surface protein [Dysgonomonas reticulitermitis]
MKTYIKNILLLTVVFIASVGVFSSCSDDNDNGSAVVRYVRSTDATASDSIITKAFLGATIAIIGDNLDGVKEVWFNDQKAKLNPVYVTNHSILVSIPNDIPGEVTGKIRLVTGAGSETLFDFGVDVPTPVLTSLKCEYVADGDIAVINGDFFLEPKVYFNGNMLAEIVSFTKTQIQVKVPAGSKAGPITVESLYGSTRSKFSFRDNNVQTPTTHIFIDFEDTSWNTWGFSAFANGGGPTGTYMVMEGSLGSWAWPANPLQFYYNSPTRQPIASEGEISEMALRFEVYSHEWHDTPLLIWFSNQADTHNVDGNDAQAHWKPYLKNGVKSNYVTDGWVTVTIPLTDFKYSKDESEEGRSITSLNELVDLHAMFFGAADATTNVKLWIDNMRIVKYK